MVQERYARVCLAVAGLLAGVFATHAHPGGLDKQGCHANRKTGEHHCHRDVAPARAVRRGDPGYGPHLDRDNDGVGCEPYRGR